MADYKYTNPVEPVDNGVVGIVDYYVAPVTNDPVVEPEAAPSSGLSYMWRNPYATAAPAPKVLDRTAARDLSLTALKAGEPLGYVFGHTTVKPKIITVHEDGDYLYVDYFISVGECQEIVSVQRGGEDIGKPVAWEYLLGTSSQAASTLMTGVLGSYDTLPNICHVVAKLERDDPIDCEFVVKGLKLADPRNSPETTAYSTNPALALARMLTDCGYTVDRDSVATVANFCDESVSGSARWTINLQCSSRQNVSAWITTLAEYANCFIDYQAGAVTLVPDAVVTASPQASKTITSADIVEGSAKTSITGTRQAAEQVTVIYRELDGTQRSATAGTGDTGRRSRLQLPGIQTYTEARRKAEEVLAKAQLDVRHEHISFDEGLADAVGDIVDITYAPHNLTAKRMRLVGNEEVQRGRWKRSFIEYSDSPYNNSVYTGPTRVETTTPSTETVPDGPTPVLTEELYTSPSGITYYRLKARFRWINWAKTYEYVITITADDGSYEETQTRAYTGYSIFSYSNVYMSEGMSSGKTYTVKVWIRSINGRLSETPGQASTTSTLGNTAELNEGDLTNMHVYILDGDGRYATTSEKTGSPQTGETWSSRFSTSPLGAWSAGETWLGNQVCETVFQTEVWDSGAFWSGMWRWTSYSYITKLGGASSAEYVALSDAVSPLVFTDNAGTSFSDEAQYMKAKSVVSDSPLSAGMGLHVKLPIVATFSLGN